VSNSDLSKILVAQGGGPTAVINQSMAGVVLEARKFARIEKVYGALHGVRGIVNQDFVDLSQESADNLERVAETPSAALGSTRDKPDGKYCEAIFRSLKAHGIGSFFYIGGNDSSDTVRIVSEEAQKENYPLRCIHIPKTIDNDLMVTDFTFGFDTAINIVTEAVDRIRTTTESHRRCCVVETMGRHAGWIACFSGISVAADYILVPEIPIDIDHVVAVLKRRRAEGKNYGIVVVSEGAEFPDKGMTTLDAETDAFGHVRLGGVGNAVAKLIEDATGYETRCVVLGHLQRGGPPSAYDRVLATRLGLAAGQLVVDRKFGTMVALKGTKIIETTLSAGVAATKTLDMSYYEEARTFFK
jgi:ATP-dependent phosphofructokinase / diphosphate-dependent phosphofructokinase